MKSVYLSALVISLSVFHSPLCADERKVELRNGVLAVHAGEYQATFSYGHHWNLSSLSYAELPVVIPGGANQFTVKMKDSSGGSLWYGGIAQPERVQSVTFYVDDAPHSLPPSDPGTNKVFNPGERFAIEKVGLIGPYQVTVRTTIDSEGVSEQLNIQAAEATENVAFLYPSRFSFGGDYQQWFGIMADGFEEEGEFGKNGSTSINRQTLHLALHDEKNQQVVLVSTPEEPASEGGNHFIWNNAGKLHFHSKRPPLTDADGGITIRRHLSVWPIEGGDWKEQVRKKAE